MSDLMELVNQCEATKEEKPVKQDAIETAKRLASLGFKAAAEKIAKTIQPILKRAEIAANGYIEITPAKIQAFLDKKAEEYDKMKPSKKSSSPATAQELNDGIYGHVQRIHDSLLSQSTYAYWSGTSTGASLGTMRYSNINAEEAWNATPRKDSQLLSKPTKDYMNSREGNVGQYAWTEETIENYSGIPPISALTKLEETKGKKIFDYFTVASVKGIPDPLLLGRIDGSESRWFLAQWGDDVSLDDVI